MRQLAAALVVATLGLPSAVGAQEPATWLFGLESRVSRSEARFANDYEWGFIPNFSYYVSERIRVDGFLGFAYSDSDDYSLSLMPGVRYYHRPGPGRVRLNSGLSVGFKVLEEWDDAEYQRQVQELSPDAVFEPWKDELLYLRLVPLEIEYWLKRRGAFTVGFDYGMRVRDGGATDDEDFGITAGFRFRLK